MTIKELQKLIQEQEGPLDNEHNRLILDEYKDKSFAEFNRVIGLPKKNGKQLEMFDYELDIVNKLENETSYLWIKKARGLGITECLLRYLIFCGLCQNEKYNQTKCLIVCGPREKTALELVKRLKRILEPLHLVEDTDKTICSFLGFDIQVFPSHNLAVMRGYTDVSIIYVDEADFFIESEQQETRDVCEGYIGKCPDVKIVMVSTPNRADGMFAKIEREEPCLYTRLKLSWESGLNKIYSQDDLNQARRSSSWQREYCLAYSGRRGNAISEEMIKRATSFEYEVPEAAPVGVSCIMGLDPAYAASAFGICICTFKDDKIQVVYSNEIEHAEHSGMVSMVVQLVDRFNVDKIYVDGSAVSFIKSLKIELSENPDYDSVFARAQHDKIDPELLMRVIPVSFAKYGKVMLQHCKALMSDNLIAINEQSCQRLLIACHTAQETEGLLHKQAMSHSDVFDAYLLGLRGFEFT
jgi:hypothetical protein